MAKLGYMSGPEYSVPPNPFNDNVAPEWDGNGFGANAEGVFRPVWAGEALKSKYPRQSREL